jgi:hypothetical protein
MSEGNHDHQLTGSVICIAMFNGKPVKITGLLNYNFVAEGQPAVFPNSN